VRVEQIGSCTLILADNREVLPGLGQFDLLMADPPYGIGESSDAVGSRQRRSGDFADCELAWTNWPTAVRRIQHLWNGMIRKGKEERFHPTQKPLDVIGWAIGLAPKSDTVLDPWMGSGTAGVACAKSGRAFTGIDRNEQYFDVACRRIEQAYAAPDMFIERPAHAKQEQLL
jgi:DNA modification methylase